MESHGILPRELRDLVDVIGKPLSIIFERSWRMGELSGDWRKPRVTPAVKNSKKDNPGTHTSPI